MVGAVTLRPAKECQEEANDHQDTQENYWEVGEEPASGCGKSVLCAYSLGDAVKRELTRVHDPLRLIGLEVVHVPAKSQFPRAILPFLEEQCGPESHEQRIKGNHFAPAGFSLNSPPYW